MSRGGNRTLLRRAFRTGTIITVLLTFAAGCSNGPEHHASGTVTGIAAPCVGIAPPGRASVTIYARRNGRVVNTDRVVLTRSPGNPYRMRLPAGEYVLSAPLSGLPTRTISVQAHETVRVNFRPSCK